MPRVIEGYGAYEADVMDVEPAPFKADWRDKTRGSSPHSLFS
jgi:hypothetical protein